MKTLITSNRINRLFRILAIIVLFTSCQEDDETIISNDLRVLKITNDGNDLEQESEVDTENLVLEMIFSHPLNPSAFESALQINAPDYTVSYDETNSFVQIAFPSLEFDTEYTIQLPAGAYGVNGESLQNEYTFQFKTAVFVPSKVTLSVDESSLLEGESTVVTATLNEPTIDDVIVSLALSGNAIQDDDYTLSETSMIIPTGSISSSVTLFIENDSEIEGEELIVIDIAEVTNAVEDGEQQVVITVTDENPALILKGIMALRWATEADGNSGKAVHLVAMENIDDLSIYGLGVANNGGGTDGLEYSLPSISVNAGDDILISRDPTSLEAYFEGACFSDFEHVIQSNAMSQNGNDAIELYKELAIIETYGNADVDGVGQDWEYTSSWAYKLGDTWTTGSVNCSAGSTTTLGSDCTYPLCDNPLILKGVLALLWDGSGTNGGKAVHLMATKNISDLSQYSVGVANNGGGTDGIEYTFPAIEVAEGEHIILAREVATLNGYFGNCFDGYDHIFETDAMNQNGDDAIELFLGTEVIETYGDANVDGTGQFWEYAGSWGYKLGGSWTYGGVDCAASATSNQGSACPYLFCQ